MLRWGVEVYIVVSCLDVHLSVMLGRHLGRESLPIVGIVHAGACGEPHSWPRSSGSMVQCYETKLVHEQDSTSRVLVILLNKHARFICKIAYVSDSQRQAP
jgi:hypothetical protein